MENKIPAQQIATMLKLLNVSELKAIEELATQLRWEIERNTKSQLKQFVL